jgi:hypothetical protein
VRKRDVQTKATIEHRGHEVVRWRREQLVRSGFSLPLAARIAKDARYDLHALIALAECGCQPELAVRILAAEDGESAA